MEVLQAFEGRPSVLFDELIETAGLEQGSPARANSLSRKWKRTDGMLTGFTKIQLGFSLIEVQKH